MRRARRVLDNGRDHFFGEGAVVRGLTASIGGVAVLAATLLVAPGPATAQPTTVAGLLAHYYDLSQEAERVNEDLLVLQEQVAAQQRASTAATKVGGRRDGRGRRGPRQGQRRAGPGRGRRRARLAQQPRRAVRARREHQPRRPARQARGGQPRPAPDRRPAARRRRRSPQAEAAENQASDRVRDRGDRDRRRPPRARPPCATGRPTSTARSARYARRWTTSRRTSARCSRASRTTAATS